MRNHSISIIKNISVLLFSLFLLLTSCSEDILEEKPLDFFSPENAFLTEDGVVQGITAVHQRIRDAYYSFSEFGTMNWRAHGSDLGYVGESPLRTPDYINNYKDISPTRRYVVDTWNMGYRIIQMANVLIDKIEDLDPEIFAQGQAGKNIYLAEARFFRAFQYRYLVSTYGDIPLLTEPVESARADFVRDPVSEVRAQMIEDFSFAAEHLPDPGNEAAPGRITKGPALHYLGETYLEVGDPQSAVQVLDRVVEDFGYDLMTRRFGNHLGNDIFGSGDPYYDLFGFENHNLPENTEAMWVIQVEPLIQGGGQIGSAYAKHNIKRDYFFDNPASAYHNQKIDFSLYDPPRPNPLEDTTKILYPMHTKFLDPLNYFLQPNRAGGGITHKDWYALRFAETLLLRAEAYLGIGDVERAAADVNRVRARAQATPVSPADLDIDYILDERARELYGEEWRLVTLRRVGKLLERTLKYNDNPANPGAGMEPHHVLWPIPQAQIDLNVDADFPQNPGY